MANNYRFHNVNPSGKKEEDCVCRAISLATNQDYYKIEHQLNLIGDLFECEELCVCCYNHLLDSVYHYQRVKYVKGMTIKEFARTHPKGIFLIRIEGHLTCMIDGVIHDIWNCTNEVIDKVWYVR